MAQMPCIQIICNGGKETGRSPHVDQSTHMPHITNNPSQTADHTNN